MVKDPPWIHPPAAPPACEFQASDPSTAGFGVRKDVHGVDRHGGDWSRRIQLSCEYAEHSSRTRVPEGDQGPRTKSWRLWV